MRRFTVLGADRLSVLSDQFETLIRRWYESWCISPEEKAALAVQIREASGWASTSRLGHTEWAGQPCTNGAIWLGCSNDRTWRDLVFGRLSAMLPDDAVSEALLGEAREDLFARVADAAGLRQDGGLTRRHPEGLYDKGRAIVLIRLGVGNFNIDIFAQIPSDQVDSQTKVSAPQLERRQNAVSRSKVNLVVRLPLAELLLGDVYRLEAGDVLRAQSLLSEPFRLMLDTGVEIAVGHLGRNHDLRALLLSTPVKKQSLEQKTMTDVVERIELDELTPSAVAGKGPLVQRDMGLIKHVSVELTAEIGTASLSIEELFSLKAGEVITLHQSVEEPVLLRLNGKPVARGNLMAVNDHFGIQILEIL